MLTPLDIVLGVALPFLIALIGAFVATRRSRQAVVNVDPEASSPGSTVPYRSPGPLDAERATPFAFVLPLSIGVAYVASVLAMFSKQVWPIIDADDYLLLTVPLAALAATALALFPRRPRWAEPVGAMLIVALAVAPVLYVKTTVIGPTGWTVPTFALHLSWIAVAGGAVAQALAWFGRVDRSPVLPVILAGTALLAASWLLFGAASLQGARMGGAFAWAVAAVVPVALIRRSNVVASGVTALVIGASIALATFGAEWTEAPDRNYWPILLGPLLVLIGLVPAVRRVRPLLRGPLLVVLALLPGAAALGLSVRHYFAEQAQEMQEAADDPYGAYR